MERFYKKIAEFILSIIILISCCIVNGLIFKTIYNIGIRIPLQNIYDLPELSLYIFTCWSLIYSIVLKKKDNINYNVFDYRLYNTILSGWMTKFIYILILVIFGLIFN